MSKRDKRYNLETIELTFLVDDEVVREAIILNIIKPFREELARVTAERDALAKDAAFHQEVIKIHNEKFDRYIHGAKKDLETINNLKSQIARLSKDNELLTVYESKETSTEGMFDV